MELNKLLRRKQKYISEGNKQLLAEACNKLGNYYMNENEFEKALEEFKEEGLIFKENCSIENAALQYAKANRMISEVYILQGKFPEALRYINLYLKIAKNESDILEIQRAYCTIGRCLLLQGISRIENNNDEEEALSREDFKSAEKWFLKSLIKCKDIGKSVSKIEQADMQARLYLNLGVTKEHMKHYDEAINYYDTAIKLCASNDIFELNHQCLMTLGLCYAHKKENFQAAMNSFNAALEVAKRISDKNNKMCESLLAKSDVLLRNGDFQSAKQVLKKAFKLRTSIEEDMQKTINKKLSIVHSLCKYEDELIMADSFDYATRRNLYERLGDEACKLKNYTKAIDFYLKMLEAAQLNGDTGEKLIPIYVSLYQTYIDNKNYDDARKYLDMEYELIKDDPKEACSTLLSIGNLLHSAKADFWEVNEAYKKAMREAKRAHEQIVEKAAMKKLIAICKQHSMINLAEMYEKEAKDNDIDLNEDFSDDTESSDDILNSDVINTLELELSSEAESSGDEMRTTSKEIVTKRRKRGLAAKKNAKGETRLHEACISGNYQMAKLLIAQGHAINVRDNAGWLPLHEAANHGHKDIVEMLLDNGAQSAINDKGGVNCDGISPLYDACSNGHLSVVELLLDRGAKATIKTDSDQTPLEALEKWRSDCGKLTVSEEELYENLKSRLAQQCQRLGIQTKNKRQTSSPSASFNSSGYCSAEPKTQQSSQRASMRYSLQNNDEYLSDEKSPPPSSMNENLIKKKARVEYKNAMENLKNPRKDAKKKYNIADSPDAKKRTAYMANDEIDPDEWLEDDLGPIKKKQRFFNENSVKLHEKDRIIESPHKSNFSRKPSSNLLDSDVEDKSDVVELLSDYETKAKDSFDILMKVGDGCNRKTKAKMRRNSSSKSLKKSQNQSSLLDAGFARFVEVNEPSISKQSLTPLPKSDYYGSRYNLIPNHSIYLNKQFIVKVQVKDEKFVVPIDKETANELKISWLIEESARRYYCLKGIRPDLKLKTADGAILLETDPLSLIQCLAEENLIYSEILSWKLPPLSTRYLEACAEYKCGVDSEINELLENNRAGIHLDLSNQNLISATAKPIFRALRHQATLMHLDLSSNFLQDEGLKYLTETLITLKNLTVLDLSGNMLTDDGIEELCDTLVRNTTLQEIRQLKLNFNPIQSASLRHISKMCCEKSIRSLSLISCELVNASGMEMMNTVKDIEVAFNHLTYDGFKELLLKLNPTVIETLNFERCSIAPNLGDLIVEFITSGCQSKLKEINLAGLKLSENDILNVLRNLAHCENLRMINLSFQQELTLMSFKYILLSMNNRNMKVNLIGCRNLQSTTTKLNLQAFDVSPIIHPCQIFLSVPSSFSKMMKNEYVMHITEIWNVVTRNRGYVHLDRNILNLSCEKTSFF